MATKTENSTNTNLHLSMLADKNKILNNPNNLSIDLNSDSFSDSNKSNNNVIINSYSNDRTSIDNENVSDNLNLRMCVLIWLYSLAS